MAPELLQRGDWAPPLPGPPVHFGGDYTEISKPVEHG